MNRLLRTTVIGSYGRPPWLWAAKEQVRAGAFGAGDFGETLDDAVRMAIQDQEEAGVDLITDGEMRREGFTLSFYERLGAIRKEPPFRKAGPPGYDTMPVYYLEGRIDAPQGLGIREEFRRARPLALKPLKVGCPGPLTLLPRLPPVGGESTAEVIKIAREVAAVINRELKGLVEDGAEWLQVDEPALTRVTSEEPHRYPSSPSLRIEPAQAVSLLNEAIEGVKAHITVHFCFGSYYSLHRSKRTYRPLLPALFDLRADALAIEFGNRELAELELLREFPPDKEIVAGLIDVKSYYVERPEDVAERVRRALEFIAPDRLWVSPDCGFRFVPRWLAREKLRNMVAGVERVRGKCKKS